jgi:hypothetical protein
MKTPQELFEELVTDFLADVEKQIKKRWMGENTVIIGLVNGEWVSRDHHLILEEIIRRLSPDWKGVITRSPHEENLRNLVVTAGHPIASPYR